MVEGNHIYNLLTIGLSRYAHFPLLVEVNMLFLHTLSRLFKTDSEQLHYPVFRTSNEVSF
jgi:hypothetical protein